MQQVLNPVTGTVIINRSQRGILKKTPASVSYNSILYKLLPGQSQSIEVTPGDATNYVTLILNRRRKIQFRINAGETKTFNLEEGIYNWDFRIKFGAGLLLLLYMLFAVIYHQVTGNKVFGGVFGLLFACWALYEVRYEYFYVNDKEVAIYQ